MATIYHVRHWCEDCDAYHRTEQSDTLNPSWINGDCTEHATRDFVVELVEIE